MEDFSKLNLIGQSPAFLGAVALIGKYATCDATALIEGETGTGKEVAARAIHYLSQRRGFPFIPVNCAALPDTLIENELFGHRRGAYTDARTDQPGLVALARGGTLFLDEVDALSKKGQVTLLRFLQDRQFRPLGATREEQADVRVVAASNRDLEREVTAGEFRLDLFYRLKLLHIVLPPLRERCGDPKLLAEHFVGSAAGRYGKPRLPVDRATLDWFERYAWPGNIRELENLVHRSFLLVEGPQISIAAPDNLRNASQVRSGLNYRQAKSRAIAEFESQFLSNLLSRAQGNVSAAARISGTERRQLGRLLKKYGISKQTLQA
ncbi:MAG: sigma 54-interacting transcriptional regulator [Betaproteobacteria bacterium]|nr:sigma 54-interacting transcriptional regulator [Betaproteobacteria bacterium]